LWRLGADDIRREVPAQAKRGRIALGAKNRPRTVVIGHRLELRDHPAKPVAERLPDNASSGKPQRQRAVTNLDLFAQLNPSVSRSVQV
jgi:hypothetical protein